MSVDDTPIPDAQKTAGLKSLTTVIYVLYAVSLFVGITAVIAVVLNYIKRDEVEGTWLESHFRWQIRTFWWALLWTVVGALTWIILIGWVVWAVAFVWFVYRIAKGFLNLNDNKPMLI